AGDGVLRNSRDGARVVRVLQHVRGGRPAGRRPRTHTTSARLMDLKDLYRDVIVDHNRNPRNFGRLEPADVHADGHNPLCGDRLSVYANLDGDRIADIRFQGSGCAISVSSASLLTEAVK